MYSSKSSPSQIRYRIFLTTCLVVTLLTWGIALWQYQHYSVVAFYGDDTFAHLDLVAGIQAKLITVTPGQPYLFQYTVGLISNVFHSNILNTYSMLAILSLPLTVLAISLLSRRLFGNTIGLLTVLFIGIVSIQPTQTYFDGTIPNIFGMGVLFPTTISFLVAAQHEARHRKFFICLAAASSATILLTHHLSSLVMLAVFAACCILSSAWIAVKLEDKRLALIPLLALIAIGLAVAIAKPHALVSLMHEYIQFSSTFPWLHPVLSQTPRDPWNAVIYGTDVGGVLFQLGILGLFLVLIRTFRSTNFAEALPMILLVSWAGIYWLGSLTRYSGEPSRLGRDFALPGSILAAYALREIWRLGHKYHLVIAQVTVSLLLLACIVPARHRIQAMTKQPQVLYGTQDRLLVKNLKQFEGKIYVAAPNYFWITASRLDGAEITPIASPAEIPALTTASDTSCVIQIYYSVSMAAVPPSVEYSKALPSLSGYRIEEIETPTHRLSVACKE